MIQARQEMIFTSRFKIRHMHTVWLLQVIWSRS